LCIYFWGKHYLCIFFEGLEKPSAVHQRGIVPLCKGFGVVHRSLTGTTEIICSGVLQQLDYGSAECQALILVPTPYLAQVTEKVLGALGQFLGVTAQTCTGGTIAPADQQTLSSRVQVVVGTPDCILDMLQRQALSPDHIRMLFLDEADELLTGGSKDQVSFVTCLPALLW
jgi:translation initiation factor 4A